MSIYTLSAGEPDAFKGDTVWKRVQEYAQEALNALHGEPEAAAPTNSSLRVRGGVCEGAAIAGM